MKKLYRFYYDYSDTCEFLSGIFIEEEEVVKKTIGKRVYFDLWGVDEIMCTFKLNWNHLEEINISDSALEELEKTFNGYICGHNPLDYISEY